MTAPTQRPDPVDLIGIGVSVMDITMVVDEVPVGEAVVRASERKASLGGGVAVAMATAAKLGGKAAMVDLLGTDTISQSIIDQMQAAGVDTSLIQRNPDTQASLASVLVRKDNGERTIVFSPGTDGQPQYTPQIEQLISTAQILHLNGRHLDVACAAIQTARQHNVLVSYDGGAHRYRSEIIPLLRETDILIVSKHFAESHVVQSQAVTRNPVVHSPALLASRLMSEFACHIVGVTDGQRGSWFVTRDGDQWRQAAVPTRYQRDTTGCGDTFHGAFLFALASGRSLKQCSELAALIASRNAEALGAFAFELDQVSEPR
ncbi:carbohydrate kinase family protein [Stieleria varia]|uniref:5-dehydro-2-deoxygluconokinase n=1 Tax=Stieleria varia TaxID=2528005 RepID=A0A5C6B797_9BACT|nr:carbohydrate kinase family protein [Stieleria varia]TWU07868.1 5-dehydro-2-deoxygluconokinase [Stieleria varia]